MPPAGTVTDDDRSAGLDDDRSAGLDDDRSAGLDDDLDRMFAALADRTRRAIVADLADGDRTVNELAAPFPISLQAVSRHIQVLERAGLVSRRRERQRRPCHLEADRLAPAIDWISRNRQIWTDRFDKLQAHLERLQTDRAQAPPSKGTAP